MAYRYARHTTATDAFNSMCKLLTIRTAVMATDIFKTHTDSEYQQQQQHHTTTQTTNVDHRSSERFGFTHILAVFYFLSMWTRCASAPYVLCVVFGVHVWRQCWISWFELLQCCRRGSAHRSHTITYTDILILLSKFFFLSQNRFSAIIHVVVNSKVFFTFLFFPVHPSVCECDRL